MPWEKQLSRDSEGRKMKAKAQLSAIKTIVILALSLAFSRGALAQAQTESSDLPGQEDVPKPIDETPDPPEPILPVEENDGSEEESQNETQENLGKVEKKGEQEESEPEGEESQETSPSFDKTQETLDRPDEDADEDLELTEEQEEDLASKYNPYADGFSWSDLKAAPEEQAQEEDDDEGFVEIEDETPETVVESQERVMPTSDLNTEGGAQARPFSVGGITAEVSDETWFKFFGFMQTRYLSHWNKRGGEGDRQVNGFNIARARVFFYGRMLDWLTILLRAGATNNGSLRIEQAYADFRWDRFTFRVGQWYLPLFQEQLPSPDSTLTINPSAVGGVFDGGQVQGLRALFDLGRVRLQASTSNGMRTAFSEVGSATVAEIAVSTRAETIIGDPDFSRFSTGSSFRGQDFAALLGASAHYQVGGDVSENSLDIAQGSVDATMEYGGFNLHTSLAINSTETTSGDQNINLGMVAQGGLFVLDWTELYARYEALVTQPGKRVTRSLMGDSSVFRGLTFGVNQYFWPERGLRAQLDYVYYPDGLLGTPVVANTNAGLFPTSGAQWAIRSQLNLMF